VLNVLEMARGLPFKTDCSMRCPYRRNIVLEVRDYSLMCLADVNRTQTVVNNETERVNRDRGTGRVPIVVGTDHLTMTSTSIK
jgi:arginase family enzyme